MKATLDYNDQSFTDRNASHHYEYAWLAPEVSAQLSWPSGARRYTLIPGVSYRLPLSESVRVPEKNRNLYTTYALVPDYYLHTSSVASLRGGFQFTQRFGDLSAALLIDYRRRILTSEGEALGTPEFLPGDARNTISLTLQFFH